MKGRSCFEQLKIRGLADFVKLYSCERFGQETEIHRMGKRAYCKTQLTKRKSALKKDLYLLSFLRFCLALHYFRIEKHRSREVSCQT